MLRFRLCLAMRMTAIPSAVRLPLRTGIGAELRQPLDISASVVASAGH
jgi:hypothetical protein